MSSIMSTLARRSLRSARFSRLLTRHHHSSSSPASSYLRKPHSSISSIFNPIRFSSSSSAVATRPSSDKKLSRVLQSEIECAVEERDEDPIEGGDLPEGFPFEIIDNPGEETITLKRELDGESIEVVVHSPQMAEGEEDSEDDGKDGTRQVDMTLIVTVDKGKGARLEFTCNANMEDGITIDSMLFKQADVSADEIPYEGPEFSDLDENLQKELHAYLVRRGIEGKSLAFLHMYMMNKDNNEYVKWLQNMKEFVEK